MNAEFLPGGKGRPECGRELHGAGRMAEDIDIARRHIDAQRRRSGNMRAESCQELYDSRSFDGVFIARLHCIHPPGWIIPPNPGRYATATPHKPIRRLCQSAWMRLTRLTSGPINVKSSRRPADCDHVEQAGARSRDLRSASSGRHRIVRSSIIRTLNIINQVEFQFLISIFCRNRFCKLSSVP